MILRVGRHPQLLQKLERRVSSAANRLLLNVAATTESTNDTLSLICFNNTKLSMVFANLTLDPLRPYGHRLTRDLRTLCRQSLDALLEASGIQKDAGLSAELAPVQEALENLLEVYKVPLKTVSELARAASLVDVRYLQITTTGPDNKLVRSLPFKQNGFAPDLLAYNTRKGMNVTLWLQQHGYRTCCCARNSYIVAVKLDGAVAHVPEAAIPASKGLIADEVYSSERNKVAISFTPRKHRGDIQTLTDASAMPAAQPLVLSRITREARSKKKRQLMQCKKYIQYGRPRTASTFQFYLLLSILRVKGEMEKPTVTKMHHVPSFEEGACIFISRAAVNHNERKLLQTRSVIHVQEFEHLKMYPEVQISEMASIFSLNHSQEHVVLVHMRLWMILRQCCGSQSSQFHRLRLHNLTSYAFNESTVNCGLYNVQEVENSIMQTTLGRKYPIILEYHRPPLKIGFCSAWDAKLSAGADFNGKRFSDTVLGKKFHMNQEKAHGH